MANIHPSAVVDPHAELADDVVVGPFCLIGPRVRIGAGTVLRSHVVVDGTTEIGCIQHIERGYENLVEKLAGIGADIRVVDEDEEEQSLNIG